MKLKTITLKTACTCLLALLGAASHGQTRYDFTYSVSDDRIQVFDDGAVTRISLPEGTFIPTVIAVQAKGEVLLSPRKDTSHLMLEGIHSRLILRWGNGREVIANYGCDSN